ncbi:MAG: aminoacyl-histidine dipeptidase, partial [Acutalibacteraceae bacterium]|nr:aminoacyl-histidine dipeptidase [Acutalibacteraceae bacterium]
MRKLENLEPKKVFYFFEDLCAIPHGSGNTKKISDYCKDFAEKRGLFCIQDEHNNIIIKK